MPTGKESTIKLPSLDELFSSQEERDDAKLKRIYEIPLDQIDPFPDHPYKVRDDEDMRALVESVRANGIITPAVVRKKEDGRYEILSGHRRYRACEIAGLDTMRCEVVEMKRDEATIFMVESNIHRNTVLPSEKAFAYREFMASEIQDDDFWNGADTVSNEQFTETFKSGLWDLCFDVLLQGYD